MTLSLIPNCAPRGDLAIHTACRQAIERVIQVTETAHDEMAHEIEVLRMSVSTIAASESFEAVISELANTKSDAIAALRRLLTDEMTRDDTLRSEIEDEMNPEPDADFPYDRRRDDQMMPAMGCY